MYFENITATWSLYLTVLGYCAAYDKIELRFFFLK